MTEFDKESEASSPSNRREYFKLMNFRQYSWYIFALGIYLFCAGIGFLLAYFALRTIINFQIAK